MTVCTFFSLSDLKLILVKIERPCASAAANIASFSQLIMATLRAFDHCHHSKTVSGSKYSISFGSGQMGDSSKVSGKN